MICIRCRMASHWRINLQYNPGHFPQSDWISVCSAVAAGDLVEYSSLRTYYKYCVLLLLSLIPQRRLVLTIDLRVIEIPAFFFFLSLYVYGALGYETANISFTVWEGYENRVSLCKYISSVCMLHIVPPSLAHLSQTGNSAPCCLPCVSICCIHAPTASV